MIININGINWKIILVNPYDDRLFMGNKFTLVVTDLSTNTICIANDLDDSTFYKVLTHEICHCLINSYGIRLSNSCEESTCQIIDEFADDVIEITDYIYSKL